MLTSAAIEHALDEIPDLHFRIPDADDREFERTLMASTMTGAGFDHLPAEALDRLADIQYEAQQASYSASWPDSTRWIIERSARPVGRIWLGHTGERLHVVDVTIALAARGEGIGTRTLTALIGLCDRCGVPLALQVATGNAGALRLYRRLGFTTTSESDSYVSMVRSPG